jgi:hypothetical protein
MLRNDARLVRPAFAALVVFSAADCGSGGGDGDGSGDPDVADTGGNDVDAADGSDSRADAADAVADVADTGVTAVDGGDDGDGPIPQCLLDCGLHGVCQVADAAQLCNCDEGWVGEACGQCESGQDNDGDGVCSLACGDEDAPDCGDAFCFDESGTAACGCPRGYNLDETGLQCTFGPWPLDGEFEGSGIWQLDGAAVAWHDYQFAGRGRGAIRVATSDICSVPVTISQQIPFSGVDWSSSYRSQIDWACQGGALNEWGYCPEPSLWINGRAASVGTAFERSVPPDTSTVSACLSPALESSDLDYRIVPTVGRDAREECDGDNLLILSAAIRPESSSGACPTEVGVPDGDFEGDAPLDAPWWGQTLGQAEVVEVFGNHLLALSGLDCAWNSTTGRSLAIPAIPGPALMMDVQVPDGVVLKLAEQLSFREFAFGPETDSVVLCLDAAVPRSHAFVRFYRSYSTASCDDGAVGPILIDNVRVESVEACVNHNGIVGGSFDDEGRTAWSTWATQGTTRRADAGFVEAVPAEWVFEARTVFPLMQMRMGTWLGGIDVEPGSAVRFNYRTVGDEGTLYLNLGQTQSALPLSPTWTTSEVCLEPFFSPASLYLALEAESRRPAGSGEDETLDATFGFDADNFEIVRGSDACE